MHDQNFSPTSIDPPVVCPPRNKMRLRLPLNTRLVILAGISAVCVFCDILGPSLFWRSRTFGRWTEELAFIALGCLLAQIGIVSVWCALGDQRFQWRFLCTLVLSIVVSCAYIIGLQVPDYPRSDMPFWAGVLILTVGVGGFLISSVLLKGIGLLTRERLCFAESSERDKQSAPSYSIGYLIGLTTGVAVVVALIRGIMPTEQERMPPGPELVLVILVTLQHAALSILLLSSCTTLVLRERKNWHGLIWIGCILLFALPADLFLMFQYRALRPDSEAVVLLISYLIGFIACSLLFLVVLRVAGYRLQNATIAN
jgi:hypothetical protein